LEINSNDENDNIQHEPITVPTTLSIMDCKSRNIVETKQNNRRSYEDAILHACQKTKSEVDIKKQTLHIVDTLHLRPYSMNDECGEEVNFLAHPTAINPSMPLISPTIPSKRQYFEVANS
jgi:hypothetical protein